MGRTTRRTMGFGAVAIVAFASLVLLAGYSPAPVSNGGTVHGTVKMRGRAPSLGAHTVNKPQQVPACGRTVPNEQIVTGAGGKLANAVVWLEGIERGAPARPRELTLDQKDCRFVPRVQAATRGSKLVLTSRDATLHNIHAYLGRRTLFNLAIPTKGVRIPKRLTRPGMVSFKCDAGHTWMRGYVRVFEHPYFAVTDEDGEFTIEDVPPGRHRIEVWHERLGEKSGTVQVGAGASASWDVSLAAK